MLFLMKVLVRFSIINILHNIHLSTNIYCVQALDAVGIKWK